ncbi:MAG: hypothetical protein IJE09_06635 [Oscillospiraceae bacterium]|nr:hypothetical protein [Oscillospiraceae bacterium]
MYATTKEQYENQHRELMEEWQIRHGANIGQCGFAKDGIVYPNVWFSLAEEEERVLFLLKEAYTVENPKLVWDEAKWLSHQKCMNGCEEDCRKCSITGSTFNPVAEWAYGIFSTKENVYPKYDDWLGVSSKKIQDYYIARDALLSRLAIVNIKKSSGVSASDNSDLYYYAALDKELLIRQIALIDPTVIICGGTYGMLRCLFTELGKLDNMNDGHTKLGKIKIIASCHPNSRTISKADKYKAVLDNYIAKD